MKTQTAPAVRKQSGASAVEFALPLLSYGTMVYGQVFMVYESINDAARRGAEAAVAVRRTQTDHGAGVVRQSAAAATLDGLPAAHKTSSIGAGGSAILVEGGTVDGALACGGDSNTAQALAVTIDFPLVNPPVFPLLGLSLPGGGTMQVPPLPHPRPRRDADCGLIGRIRGGFNA